MAAKATLIIIIALLIGGCVAAPRSPYTAAPGAAHNALGLAASTLKPHRPAWADEFEAAANMFGSEWFSLLEPSAAEDGGGGAFLALTLNLPVRRPARIYGKKGLLVSNRIMGSAPHFSMYILEDYCPDLGLIYEDIKVGPYFARRYYVPILYSEQTAGMLTIAAANSRPLRIDEYIVLRDFALSLVNASLGFMNWLFGLCYGP